MYSYFVWTVFVFGSIIFISHYFLVFSQNFFATTFTISPKFDWFFHEVRTICHIICEEGQLEGRNSKISQNQIFESLGYGMSLLFISSINFIPLLFIVFNLHLRQQNLKNLVYYLASDQLTIQQRGQKLSTPNCRLI